MIAISCSIVSFTFDLFTAPVHSFFVFKRRCRRRLLNAERINCAQLYCLGFRSVPSSFALPVAHAESRKNLVSRLQFPATCNSPQSSSHTYTHAYIHTRTRTLWGLHSKERWLEGGSVALLGCVTIIGAIGREDPA